MRKRSILVFLSIIVLIAATLACGGGDATLEPAALPAATEEPAAPAPTKALVEPTEPPASGGGDYDTVFPLPDDVQNFTKMGGDMINFQTNLGLDETVKFYRQAFDDLGLTERDILTVIDDAAFSMVFDGWENDRAVVIQGVDMSGSTNVNIRFEDV